MNFILDEHNRQEIRFGTLESYSGIVMIFVAEVSLTNGNLKNAPLSTMLSVTALHSLITC